MTNKIVVNPYFEERRKSMARGTMLKLENIGEQLERIRDSQLWSNKELADAIGLSEKHIFRLLSGEVKKIRAATLRQITTMLNLDFEIVDTNITFTPKKVDTHGLDVLEQEFLEHLRSLPPEGKEDLARYLIKVREQHEQEGDAAKGSGKD